MLNVGERWRARPVARLRGGEVAAGPGGQGSSSEESGSRRLCWRFSVAPPEGWGDELERVGGGFFHAPLGLKVGAPAGEALYCRLLDGETVVGVGLGVRSSCRLSSRPRHVYFPAYPAIAVAAWREQALAALIDELGRWGAAEVVIDPYDTRWMPERVPYPEGASRVEHVIAIDADPEPMMQRFGDTFRRTCRRGGREEWELRTLFGEGARRALQQVQTSAALRALEHGRAFVPAVVGALETPHARGGGGVQAFGAFAGETLLAAALVGIAARRGYYVLGGSTPEGYRCRAAVWLHWRIMAWLGERGCHTYNLGGTPAAAAHPDDPGHGLYRFKSGFGGALVPSQGARWVPRPLHVFFHHTVRRAGALRR